MMARKASQYRRKLIFFQKNMESAIEKYITFFKTYKKYTSPKMKFKNLQRTLTKTEEYWFFYKNLENNSHHILKQIS